MTPAARVSAAIEVLADIENRHRPAADALREWGLSHRFAGSGDRAAIGGLVYDALRHKASASHLMGAATPRANVLGMLKLARGLEIDAIGRLFDGARFAPEPLTAEEKAALEQGSLGDAEAAIAGDYPAWLDPHLARIFGNERGAEGAGLAARASLDLRVNTLKGDRAAAIAALSHLNPEATPWSPVGLRITRAPDAKSPAIQAEPAFLKGLVEVQDEGSQVASLLSGAKPDLQVVDLCAGGGGKTLALAALMDNRGQIYSTDTDKRRLAPIHERLERAGVRNVQVRTPRGEEDPVSDLEGEIDLVLIDAPCTGTGTWRRNPDAKWRMRPGALEQRVKTQAEVLDRAAALVKPSGRIVYITCSVLMEENNDQVRSFLSRQRGFAAMPPTEVAEALGERAGALLATAVVSPEGLLMTPRRTGTDGFFVSVIRRG
jgi:16S rRNA (cytosine967-C5)-methyltransferase